MQGYRIHSEMEVLDYIKKLLYRCDCVVIPGFGGIIASYNSADIHPVTHRFAPPSKKLAFNELLSKNDGLLQNEIARGAGISYEEAGDKIKEYIRLLNEEIGRNNFVELKDVGKFYRNPEKKLEFQPDNKVNYLEESFGLPEFVYKPIERNNIMSNIPPHQRPRGTVRSKSQRPPVKRKEGKSGNKTGVILGILIPLLLIGAGTIFFLTGDNSKDNFLSFMFSSSAPEKEEVTTEAEIKEPEAEASEGDKAEKPVEDAGAFENAYSGSAGKYSIIVGSFEKEKNALKLKRKIEETGNPVLVLPGNNFYRVSVAEFNDWNSAVSNLDTYKSRYNQEAWVLVNK